MMHVDALKQTAKTDDDKDIRYIFCPLHNQDDHWHLMVMDLEERQIIHYNSLGTTENYTSVFNQTVSNKFLISNNHCLCINYYGLIFVGVVF